MTYHSPLIGILRDRWVNRPYPMIVDHGAQARACPAPSLYLGARHWARVFEERGIEEGHRIHLPPSPSAETLMMILGAIRSGIVVSFRDTDGPDEIDSDHARFQGLMLEDGRTSEDAFAEAFRSTPVRDPVCWWSLGDWRRTDTWRDDLLLALATGAELHLNLDHYRPNSAAEDAMWPAVVGSADHPRTSLPFELENIPTPWIPSVRVRST